MSVDLEDPIIGHFTGRGVRVDTGQTKSLHVLRLWIFSMPKGLGSQSPGGIPTCFFLGCDSFALLSRRVQQNPFEQLAQSAVKERSGSVSLRLLIM